MKKDSLFNELLKKLDLGSSAAMVPLAGDASTREYYRIVYPGGTLILMSQDAFEPDSEPFIYFQKLYKSMNVRVPSIHSVYPEEGLMVLEDLGDEHLQNIDELNPDFGRYYKEAVDIIADFQLRKTEVEIRFTHQKFLSELDMTTGYYLEGLKKREISSDTKNRLNSFYNELVNMMMAQQVLLQHRDYHSRNLLVHKNRIYVIDFQDSRMGPYTYDIASLVIDPYVNLNAGVSNDLLSYYYERTREAFNTGYDEFFHNYSLCCLQRGIKILGTFAYQHVKFHNDVYLQYIPVTMEKVKGMLEHFPQWKGIIEEVIMA